MSCSNQPLSPDLSIKPLKANEPNETLEKQLVQKHPRFFVEAIIGPRGRPSSHLEKKDYLEEKMFPEILNSLILDRVPPNFLTKKINHRFNKIYNPTRLKQILEKDESLRSSVLKIAAEDELIKLMTLGLPAVQKELLNRLFPNVPSDNEAVETFKWMMSCDEKKLPPPQRNIFNEGILNKIKPQQLLILGLDSVEYSHYILSHPPYVKKIAGDLGVLGQLSKDFSILDSKDSKLEGGPHKFAFIKDILRLEILSWLQDPGHVERLKTNAIKIEIIESMLKDTAFQKDLFSPDKNFQILNNLWSINNKKINQMILKLISRDIDLFLVLKKNSKDIDNEIFNGFKLYCLGEVDVGNLSYILNLLKNADLAQIENILFAEIIIKQPAYFKHELLKPENIDVLKNILNSKNAILENFILENPELCEKLLQDSQNNLSTVQIKEIITRLNQPEITHLNFLKLLLKNSFFNQEILENPPFLEKVIRCVSSNLSFFEADQLNGLCISKYNSASDSTQLLRAKLVQGGIKYIDDTKKLEIRDYLKLSDEKLVVHLSSNIPHMVQINNLINGLETLVLYKRVGSGSEFRDQLQWKALSILAEIYEGAAKFTDDSKDLLNIAHGFYELVFITIKFCCPTDIKETSKEAILSDIATRKAVVQKRIAQESKVNDNGASAPLPLLAAAAPVGDLKDPAQIAPALQIPSTTKIDKLPEILTSGVLTAPEAPPAPEVFVASEVPAAPEAPPVPEAPPKDSKTSAVTSTSKTLRALDLGGQSTLSFTDELQQRLAKRKPKEGAVVGMASKKPKDTSSLGILMQKMHVRHKILNPSDEDSDNENLNQQKKLKK